MQSGDDGHSDHAKRSVTIGRESGQGLTLGDVVDVAQAGARVRLAASAAERVRTARAFIERISGEGAHRLRRHHRLRASQPASRFPATQVEAAAAQPYPQPRQRRWRAVRHPNRARDTCCCWRIAWRTVTPACAARRCNCCSTCSTRASRQSCPSRGSVGASGDLAPLAHLSLVLIGEGEA